MIVVTGASGKLGRSVAEALTTRTAPADVRLGTRNPDKIADLVSRGFERVYLDFDDPASLQVAFTDADAVLIISGDASNDVRIRQHQNAIDAAKAGGVKRLAYTSFTNATAESLFPFAAMHAETEEYLKASGVPWTILRNNHYADNINGAIAAAKATGRLALPGPEGKVAFITHADVAAAAAGALVDDGHAGKTYEVTGPEALNLFDVAEILSRAWGRPVDAADMDAEEFSRMLAGYGLPPFAIDAVVLLRRAVAAGEYEAVSQDAEHLAGRAIEPMSDYLKRR